MIPADQEATQGDGFCHDLIRAGAVADDVAEVKDGVVLVLGRGEARVHAFQAGVDV
jgi:hypothetical protein